MKNSLITPSERQRYIPDFTLQIFPKEHHYSKHWKDAEGNEYAHHIWDNGRILSYSYQINGVTVSAELDEFISRITFDNTTAQEFEDAEAEFALEQLTYIFNDEDPTP